MAPVFSEVVLIRFMASDLARGRCLFPMLTKSINHGTTAYSNLTQVQCKACPVHQEFETT